MDRCGPLWPSPINPQFDKSSDEMNSKMSRQKSKAKAGQPAAVSPAGGEVTTAPPTAQNPGTAKPATSARAILPSVDTVLGSEPAPEAIEHFGRTVMLACVRATLAELRAKSSLRPAQTTPTAVARLASAKAEAQARPSQVPVFNLTGTVLHTNLGRAVLAEPARAAALAAMSDPTNLEYDIAKGRRGDRDDHVRGLLCEITGAEDAIAVNNNAAAVILVLNALANKREVIVSRGELVEIGGSFRMPDIMARAGAKLLEVGTTNKTHLKDYRDAIGPKTALLMKVHTSNFLVQGFASQAAHKDIGAVARETGIPFVDDLGAGVLIDMAKWGLTPERTVQTALQDGADLVLFSGDKLLGGPQCGLIVGRRDLVQKLAKNPLKRALRLDRMRLAALEATLRLYRDPDRLAERLPTLKFLTRTREELASVARALQPPLADALGPLWTVMVIDCESETGSGALPLAKIPSAGLAISTTNPRAAGRIVENLAQAFRALPRPVIGRIHDGRLIFDLRCLQGLAPFVGQLKVLQQAFEAARADKPEHG
jgi:L-seryl-tRNA(Ser) seleniumtransferase